MIKPTTGRVVLFHPAGSGPNSEPLAALVARVWNDRMINVGGFDLNGDPFKATSVVLAQDDDPIQPDIAWAEWMPYQKTQAAKYEDTPAAGVMRPGPLVDDSVKAAKAPPATDANVASGQSLFSDPSKKAP